MLSATLLIALLCVLLSLASITSAKEVCGMPCTKDVSVCQGSCGHCMSENGEDFFCGSVDLVQKATKALALTLNSTADSQAACGATCGSGNYCTTGSCIFCNCGPGGCGSSPKWACYTSAMKDSKMLVPRGTMVFELN